MRGRYRIEQAFGSVKGAYRSSVGSRSWRGVRVRVWGMLVLWNLVGLVQVGGDKVFVCLFVWLPRFFEHPQGFGEWEGLFESIWDYRQMRRPSEGGQRGEACDAV